MQKGVILALTVGLAFGSIFLAAWLNQNTNLGAFVGLVCLAVGVWLGTEYQKAESATRA